jgi:hypothetical protein
MVDVLVDFDNVVVGTVPDPEQMRSLLSRIVGIAASVWPDASRTEIKLYGGWLREGVLAPRGSSVQSAVAAFPFFPVSHPRGDGLLRGEIELVTRLAAVPEVEWQHTLRERAGLPRVRFRDGGYPLSCSLRSSACPLKQMRRFSEHLKRRCDATGCEVLNKDAFRTPEQKMVDVMIVCDALTSATGGGRVLVLSSDMDVLPAVAMAAKDAGPGRIALWRVDRYAADLYVHELEALGVAIGSWEGE